jgi:hypothetical protein
LRCLDENHRILTFANFAAIFCADVRIYDAHTIQYSISNMCNLDTDGKYDERIDERDVFL